MVIVEGLNKRRSCLRRLSCISLELTSGKTYLDLAGQYIHLINQIRGPYCKIRTKFFPADVLTLAIWFSQRRTLNSKAALYNAALKNGQSHCARITYVIKLLIANNLRQDVYVRLC